MRILHLAYEDPLQPGSGGGSVRAREINRRLADRHEITALVTGYPGAEPRVEDGVRWVPIGTRGKLGPLPTGRRFDRLAYFAVLGAEVARHPHDLLVEEFGAPFGPSFSPLFTHKPVVASVQWLFASHMREKYRLPFDWIEGYGLRFYDRFVAVSEWLTRDIQRRKPGAVVDTVPNGVDPLAFEVDATSPDHLMFLGRLDASHKGGDFLLEIFARVRSIRRGRTPRLVLVGDGPDRPAMERHARRLGLREEVEFRGRVEGLEKYRLLARSHAVLMPSRHETFGMVAVEAQAAGAPVVTFDVGPLREVVGGERRARLVKPYDLDAFAREVVHLIDDEAYSAQLRRAGRSWARRYDWDEIAACQEESYEQALAGAAPGGNASGVPRREQPGRRGLSRFRGPRDG